MSQTYEHQDAIAVNPFGEASPLRGKLHAGLEGTVVRTQSYWNSAGTGVNTTVKVEFYCGSRQLYYIYTQGKIRVQGRPGLHRLELGDRIGLSIRRPYRNRLVLPAPDQRVALDRRLAYPALWCVQKPIFLSSATEEAGTSR